MNPGICYLYEYENNRKLRNVGFLKISRSYHSCSMQIQIRNVPVNPENTIKFFAFYNQDSSCIFQMIDEINCMNKSVSARIVFSENQLPSNRKLEEIDGFFLKTAGGQFYAALSEGSTFDTSLLHSPAKPDQQPPQSFSDEIGPAPGGISSPDEESAKKALQPQKISSPETAAANSKPLSAVLPPAEISTPSGENAPALEEAIPAGTDTPLEGDGFSNTQNLSASDIGISDTPEAEIPASNIPDNPHKSTTIAEPQASQPKATEKSEAETSELAQPASQESDCSIQKIQRSQLSALPRRHWNLANNSFLMHGYHNYNHLLLVEEDGHHWLGVPGVFSAREARAAELFGFPQFTKNYKDKLELSPDEKEDCENFGHWCRYIR